MKQEGGYIYILTNPSFPQYVKIGYADDVNERLKQLNRSECIPFAFRLYAYYKVSVRLTDINLHSMIDRLNPSLRSIEDFNGKKRIREFYAMSAFDAYSILETIAEINGLKKNLVLVEPTSKEIKEEEAAEEIRTRKSPEKLPRMQWMIEQGLISVGDRICVINHPNEVAVILDDSYVEYNGKRIKILEFTKRITGWKAVQIYKVLRIEGKKETLGDLREKRMVELGMTT